MSARVILSNSRPPLFCEVLEPVSGGRRRVGAGRRVANAPVNMRAGILLHYTVGDSVTKGDAIATVYTDLGDMMDEAIHRLQSCIEYSDEPLIRLPMVTHRVSSTGTEAVAVPARLSK
jgi:hypothetical protein